MLCRLRCAPLLVLVVLALGAWGSPQFTGDDADGPGVGAAEIAALKADQPPPITAASALLEDAASGQTLWAAHPTARRAPASLTKMMTALLVRQDDSLTETFTVSADAAATPGSRMGLATGERLTVDQLLYGLLLPSGNDAAVALAEGTSGSEAAFVAAMNARAATMGLRGTHYVNPHGLDAPGHYSTAADLATLGRAVLADPVLSQVVDTRHEALAATGPNGPVQFDLTNLNQLLFTYPGADGVKTGTTEEAGQNLVGAAQRDGHQLLVVVLGSDDRYADATALLNMGWADWRWPTVALPPLATLDDGAVILGLTDAHVLPVPAWEADQVRLAFDVDAAQAARVALPRPRPVGKARWTLGGATVAWATVTAERP